jgi:tRNA pseudouridine38-40 synthase
MNPGTYKIIFSYHGKNYQGFQSQPQGQTIQDEIEGVLAKLLPESPRLTPSGRTDTGVHAFSQTVHLQTQDPESMKRIEDDTFLHRLNSLLPDDILARSVSREDSFHARRNAKQKHYDYLIQFSEAPNPFLSDFSWQIRSPLDVEAMKEASLHLIGEHDFTSFCASDSHVKTKIRLLEEVSFSEINPAPFWQLPGETYLQIRFQGKGFLKQMVRNIVGTLALVGSDKLKAEDVKTILEAKDRRKAGPTAPAHGLHLRDVIYK